MLLAADRLARWRHADPWGRDLLEVSQVQEAVVVGVDAHRRTHTLVAVDELGRKLAEKTVGTSSQSHGEAVRWARSRFDRS